jgi:peptidoglycan hydrolase-like protein with peptidoglycan-binding domain
MKSNKKLLIGAGILSAVGLYFVVKYFMGKKASESSTSTQTQGASNASQNKNVDILNTTSKPQNPYFPIKKGDRDKGAPLKPKGKVVELQKLVNTYGYKPKTGVGVTTITKLVEDGIFGDKTEWAVEQYMGKKTIDNAQDLQTLSSKLIDAKTSTSIFGSPDFSTK